MKKANPKLAEIKSLLKEVKDRKLYPYSYGKIVGDKLGVTAAAVRQVANGLRYNEEIADELLKLAKDNKMDQQIELAKEILS